MDAEPLSNAQIKVHTERDTPERAILFTIGHSNQSMDEFVALVQLHAIEVLVDVRSAPYSRYVPHFNQPFIKKAILAAGLGYVYLGRELGGRPEDLAFYDIDGRADYRKISETAAFREGIERVTTGVSQYRVALMCSEEDPTHCHRRLLVARVMESGAIEVRHIRGDGRIELDDDLSGVSTDQPLQVTMFGKDDLPQKTPEWKSTRSVLPRSLRDKSSTSI